MRIRNTGLVYDDPSQSTPGNILIFPVDGGQIFLLWPDGTVGHKWTTDNGMTNWSYLLPNGNLFRHERCENRKGVALTVSGRMSEYRSNGDLVWRHDDPYQRHDARRLSNVAIYAAFSEISDHTKAKIIGGVPGSETDGGPFGEVIRQVNDVGEVLW